MVGEHGLVLGRTRDRKADGAAPHVESSLAPAINASPLTSANRRMTHLAAAAL